MHFHQVINCSKTSYVAFKLENGIFSSGTISEREIPAPFFPNLRASPPNHNFIKICPLDGAENSMKLNYSVSFRLIGVMITSLKSS